MSMSLKAAKAGGSAYRRTADMGDPGLFGAIGGAIKGGIGSLLGGGNPLAGAVRGAVGGWKDAPARVPSRQIALPQFRPTGRPAAPSTPVATGGRGTKIQGIMKGRAAAAPGQLYEEKTPVRGGCPSGYHPNKSSYYRQMPDGSGVIHIPKGTVCVKNRRRNPMNPKALRRAVSRVDAGKKWQAKLAEISTAKYTASGKKKK